MLLENENWSQAGRQRLAIRIIGWIVVFATEELCTYC
jgi:hypothetical protein